MPEFQNTINGPFLVVFSYLGREQTIVCVQVTRNATGGAELHEINGQLSLEDQTKVDSVMHQGALTPLFI